MLKQRKPVSIHQRNLKILATENFKTKNGLNLVIREDVFNLKKLAYNFWDAETLNRSNVSSVKYGTETITFLGDKVWKILPNDYKELTSKSTLKSKIKSWETDKCPCRLCKTYTLRVGFIWLGIATSDQCLLNIILLLRFFVCCSCCCCSCFLLLLLLLLLLFLIIISIVVVVIYLLYYHFLLTGIN